MSVRSSNDEAVEFLRPLINQYRWASVLFDHYGCGSKGPREKVQQEVEFKLEGNGAQVAVRIQTISVPYASSPTRAIFFFAASPSTAFSNPASPASRSRSRQPLLAVPERPHHRIAPLKIRPCSAPLSLAASRRVASGLLPNPGSPGASARASDRPNSWQVNAKLSFLYSRRVEDPLSLSQRVADSPTSASRATNDRPRSGPCLLLRPARLSNVARDPDPALLPDSH